MEPLPSLLGTLLLAALKTKEKILYINIYIYISIYAYIWGQFDLLVLDNKPYKAIYDLSVFI